MVAALVGPLLDPPFAQVLYRHALHLHMLLGQEALLQWALHGLRAGVDAIHEVGPGGGPPRAAGCLLALRTVTGTLDCLRLQVCLCVVDQLQLELEGSGSGVMYVGSPAGDLAALASPEWQAAARSEPRKVHQLVAALVVFLEQLLEAARSHGPPAKRRASSTASGATKSRRGPGPFQSAAVRPKADLSSVQQQPYGALMPRLQRLLHRAQRELPLCRALQRQQATAAAFQAAEARAQRHRR
jgi:hypothetical protein